MKAAAHKQKEFKMNNAIIHRFSKLISEDDYEAALSYLNSCECRKTDYKILNNIGWLQLHLYDDIYSKHYKNEDLLRTATDSLKSAYNINSGSLYVLYNLGCAYFITGEYEKSVNAFSDYLKISMNSDVVNKICVLYEKQHETEKIEKLLTSKQVQTLIENKNEYFEITMYNLILILCQTGNAVKAHELALLLYENVRTEEADIQNIDLLDVVSLFFFMNDYKKVIEIFPLTSYIYSEKYYGIFLASAMRERKNIEQVHQIILTELDNEIKDMLSNNDITDKNNLIAETAQRKSAFENVYNDVKQGNFSFEPEFKALSYNSCVFTAQTQQERG